MAPKRSSTSHNPSTGAGNAAALKPFSAPSRGSSSTKELVAAALEKARQLDKDKQLAGSTVSTKAARTAALAEPAPSARRDDGGEPAPSSEVSDNEIILVAQPAAPAPSSSSSAKAPNTSSAAHPRPSLAGPSTSGSSSLSAPVFPSSRVQRLAATAPTSVSSASNALTPPSRAPGPPASFSLEIPLSSPVASRPLSAKAKGKRPTEGERAQSTSPAKALEDADGEESETKEDRRTRKELKRKRRESERTAGERSVSASGKEGAHTLSKGDGGGGKKAKRSGSPAVAVAGGVDSAKQRNRGDENLDAVAAAASAFAPPKPKRRLSAFEGVEVPVARRRPRASAPPAAKDQALDLKHEEASETAQKDSAEPDFLKAAEELAVQLQLASPKKARSLQVEKGQGAKQAHQQEKQHTTPLQLLSPPSTADSLDRAPSNSVSGATSTLAGSTSSTAPTSAATSAAKAPADRSSAPVAAQQAFPPTLTGNAVRPFSPRKPVAPTATPGSGQPAPVKAAATSEAHAFGVVPTTAPSSSSFGSLVAEPSAAPRAAVRAPRISAPPPPRLPFPKKPASHPLNSNPHALPSLTPLVRPPPPPFRFVVNNPYFLPAGAGWVEGASHPMRKPSAVRDPDGRNGRGKGKGKEVVRSRSPSLDPLATSAGTGVTASFSPSSALTVPTPASSEVARRTSGRVTVQARLPAELPPPATAGPSSFSAPQDKGKKPVSWLTQVRRRWKHVRPQEKGAYRQDGKAEGTDTDMLSFEMHPHDLEMSSEGDQSEEKGGGRGRARARSRTVSRPAPQGKKRGKLLPDQARPIRRRRLEESSSSSSAAGDSSSDEEDADDDGGPRLLNGTQDGSWTIVPYRMKSWEAALRGASNAATGWATPDPYTRMQVDSSEADADGEEGEGDVERTRWLSSPSRPRASSSPEEEEYYAPVRLDSTEKVHTSFFVAATASAVADVDAGPASQPLLSPSSAHRAATAARAPHVGAVFTLPSPSRPESTGPAASQQQPQEAEASPELFAALTLPFASVSAAVTTQSKPSLFRPSPSPAAESSVSPEPPYRQPPPQKARAPAAKAKVAVRKSRPSAIAAAVAAFPDPLSQMQSAKGQGKGNGTRAPTPPESSASEQEGGEEEEDELAISGSTSRRSSFAGPTPPLLPPAIPATAKGKRRRSSAAASSSTSSVAQPLAKKVKREKGKGRASLLVQQEDDFDELAAPAPSSASSSVVVVAKAKPASGAERGKGTGTEKTRDSEVTPAGMVRCDQPDCPAPLYKDKAASTRTSHASNYHTDHVSIKWQHPTRTHVLHRRPLDPSPSPAAAATPTLQRGPNRGEFSCPFCGFWSQNAASMRQHVTAKRAATCPGPPAGSGRGKNEY
ncbi:hypothetical protein JCM10213_000949 [Rhodosporidiobolus nylandii]